MTPLKKKTLTIPLIISSYLRLCRSRSSVSKSKRGCWTSVGPWDWRTEDEEEMTVVWPEGWMVLNWNWGPIHKRRWGPVWVTISTWEYMRNGKWGEEPVIVSLTMLNHGSTLRARFEFLDWVLCSKKGKIKCSLSFSWKELRQTWPLPVFKCK